MTMQELLPCAHCGGDNVEIREHRLSPTMEREGALVSVQILHHCKRGSGVVSAMIEFRGRDHQSAIAAWNIRADAWRGIETAPRDGTEILCWSPGFAMGLMVLSFYDGYWREKANGMGLKTPPTDWQPLPAPPAEQSE